MAACFFLFGMVFMQVFAPLFAKILGIGEKGLGILLSMSGIGGASGAVFLAAVNPNNKRGIWILSSQIALGLSLILFALSVAFDNMMVIYFMAILIGLSQAIIFPLINSVLMKITRSFAARIHSLRFKVVRRSSSIIPIFTVPLSIPKASSIRSNNSTDKAISSGPCCFGFTT